VCSRRWLSKATPQGHVIVELNICDGSFSPRSHIAYFRSVQSRFLSKRTEADFQAWRGRGDRRQHRRHAEHDREFGAGDQIGLRGTVAEHLVNLGQSDGFASSRLSTTAAIQAASRVLSAINSGVV
jgi:hypothetical protein